MHTHPSTERGAVLAVSLIFLAVLMLVAAAAVRLTMTNARIAGNIQTATEAQAIAQNAIDQVIATGNGNLSTVARQQEITTSADGSGRDGADYKTQIRTQCIAVESVEVSVKNPQSLACGQSVGIANPGCSNLIWNITATTTNANTPGGPVAVINQGVRQLPGDAQFCILPQQ